jgi:hypothetical protein
MGELTDKPRSFLDERRYAAPATHDPGRGIHLRRLGLAPD